MELLLLLGAILVVFLVMSWLFKLARATIKTVLLVLFVLLALQLLFGVGPAALWEQIQSWFPAAKP